MKYKITTIVLLSILCALLAAVLCINIFTIKTSNVRDESTNDIVYSVSELLSETSKCEYMHAKVQGYIYKPDDYYCYLSEKPISASPADEIPEHEYVSITDGSKIKNLETGDHVEATGICSFVYKENGHHNYLFMLTSLRKLDN